MSESIVSSFNLEISDIGGELVVDSRLVAAQLGIQHDNLIATIEKYEERLSTKKEVLFKTEFRERPQGGKSKVRYAFLDERQAMLLLTFSRNTEQVLDLKEALVDAFSTAKQLIKAVTPAQSDRIQELTLEVRLAELRNQMVASTSTLVSLHGEALGLAIAGFDGQVVEFKTATTEVLNPVTGTSTEFLSATQLANEVNRRTGQKVKNAEFIRKLKAANRDDLIIPVTRNTTCEYIKPEHLDEAMRIVFGKAKQGLIKPIGYLVKY